MVALEFASFVVIIGLLLWRIKWLEEALLSDKKVDIAAMERVLTIAVTQASGRPANEAAAVTSLLSKQEVKMPVVTPSKNTKFDAEYDVLYDPNGVIE